MSAVHTPVPWSVDDTNADDIQRPTRFAGPVVIYADEDCETHPIADCSCNHTCRDDAEQRANAEFIVRAVNAHADLVAAIKLARMDVINLMELLGDDDPEKTDEIIAVIDAALAKAEGRS